MTSRRESAPNFLPVNYLTRDEAEAATAVLKEILVTLQSRSQMALSSPSCDQRRHYVGFDLEVRIEPGALEVFRTADAFAPAQTTFRGTELKGFRNRRLPRDMQEVTERLRTWIDDIRDPASIDMIADLDRAERRAVMAALGAALLKDPSCSMVTLWRPHHAEVVVGCCGNSIGAEYRASHNVSDHRSATMSRPLYEALEGFGRHASINGRHSFSRFDVEIAFWDPQVTIFDEELSAQAKLRLICAADESGFSLID